ncbi:MAG: ABC transporter ATP-binding protein [Clostridia bacterium]|nr:ABC transporter ATP-binding protein [Clostridia bacterium]
MSQIICRDVSLGYGGQTVCEHVSFSLEAGACLCIVGDNGSGKSTLMRALLNLKVPQAGEILFSDGIRQSDIGYLPQQNDSQKDFPACVWEVVLSGCVMKPSFRIFADRESKQTAERALEQMGLSAFKRRPFRSLSGGQQQRVRLARALCAAQKILVLDEPTSGLDPQATEEMYDTVRRLHRELGVSVVMVTHDLSAVVDLATCVLHMSKSPHFYATVEEYCQSEDFPHKKEGC